ncbi:MAG: bifunctional hydroxymethylpyrimidine kinase/phosphomethylpyrimidine kinase [Deltaproteobacteria bacterium]|nr:bifunctional hydroxymethylpyrimidine kinase/phosphomethylpyrimidine kinase [Deltaproteobacteria bacterium]
MLTVAGSDSSAGAGVQADLATFAALGVFGTCALTAVTVQDTVRVRAVQCLPPRLVAAQIEAVLGDVGADAVKTGMLGESRIVSAVARALAAARVRNLVVDPVLRSTSGAMLLDHGGVRALRERLLPLARVMTPNLSEASQLAGVEAVDVRSATEAARRLLRLGARSVVVTGGHLVGEPVDVLADRRGIRRFVGRRVPAGAHGTGCVFSAALAAHLARGASLDEAVAWAKRFVERRLRRAVVLGSGRPRLDLRSPASSRRGVA